MPVELLPASSQEWKRRDVAFDPSFNTVCLFSAVGLILSLLFLLVIEPSFELDLTLAQLP
jgi:hypothetical protein